MAAGSLTRVDGSASVERPPAAAWAQERGRWTVRAASVLLVALVVYAAGNIGRVPLLDLGSRQAPLLLNDLAVMAVLVAGAVAMGNARAMKLNDVAIAAIVFASIGALSAVAAMPKFGLTPFEVVASLAYLARWCVYFGVYLVVINCLRTHDIEPTWAMIERVFIAMAIFGVAQATFLPDFAYKVFPETARNEWDIQGNRLVSTILDPNVMAGLIDVVLLMQLARLAFGIRVPLWKPLLLFGALVLTLSRGGMLSFGVGVGVLLLVRKPTKRMARMASVIGVVILFASPLIVEFARPYARFSVTDDSALARLYAWQRLLDTFLASPWHGIGFNTFGFVQDHRGYERLGANTYSSEGGLLFIAVMTGLVGLAVYLVMLWCVLRRCKRGWSDLRATPHERALFLGVGAATVAVLVDTLFVNTLLIVFMMELLWVLWGLTFIAAAAVRARPATT